MNEDVVYNKIKKLRKEAGFTQAELAARADVTRQTIIAIEKGSYTPSVLLALKFSDIFTTPVTDIFSYE